MRLSIFHSTSRALREFFLVLVQGYERAPRVSQLPIISDKDKGTISMGLLAFFGEYSTDYSSSMAGICLTTIPVIIAYIFFQEKIENGLMSGAVKG